MTELRPEYAHVLYEHESCKHEFTNSRCFKCNEDRSVSDYCGALGGGSSAAPAYQFGQAESRKLRSGFLPRLWRSGHRLPQTYILIADPPSFLLNRLLKLGNEESNLLQLLLVLREALSGAFLDVLEAPL